MKSELKLVIKYICATLLFFFSTTSFASILNIQSVDGKQCLDVPNSNYASSQKLIMYPCTGGANQQFDFNEVNKTLHPIKAQHLCVDLPFKRDNKGQLTLKNCDNKSRQTFSIIGDRLKNYNEKKCYINSHGHLMQGNCINNNVAKFKFNPVIDKSKTKTEYIMLSDTQYPCVWNCRVKDEATSGSNLSKLFNILNINHSKASFAMFNGDMTEYGFKYQVNHMKWLLSGILKIPHAIGMGNHDYLNNLNDCIDNQCVIRSILWMIKDTKHNPNVKNFDVTVKEYYKFPYSYVDISGSLGYVIQDGTHRLMQLQDNYSGYQVDGFKDGFDTVNFVWPHGNVVSGKNATDIAWKRYRINIHDNLNWVEKQLKQAQQNKQIMIVNKHRAHSTYGFDKLMADYNVKLKFAGHLHFNLGRSNGWYLSGAAARGNYLALNIDDNAHKATVTGYQFEQRMFQDTVILN